MALSIGFVVYPGFNLLDLSGPLGAFDTAARTSEEPVYSLRVLSEAGGLVASSSGVEVVTSPLGAYAPDTVIVVGGRGVSLALESPSLVSFVQAAASRRLASVCTGAFLLARAGVLDGRRATTHWRHAARLQRDYPRVRVEADRIFVRDGAVWSSAGITAGIDLALALIEDDMGAQVARAVARDLVVYYRRPGGQSQFSTLQALDPPSDRLRQALAYAREHLHEALPVERLAEVACLSPRQFTRTFVAETGVTPAKAIERLRAEAARSRIEESREPLEQVARGVGFSDTERMRRTFLRLFGHPPQALRRAARVMPAAAR
ncbi:MAG TPA: GlxA family transcriptional regulator [Burkholderiaceae bacterium]|nr:GlxA family transcriptional regulator [Burkholderiaceae bacterium]